MLVKNIAALGLDSVCFYSTNNNPILPYSAIVPVISYSNADIQKTAILNDNKNRVGIYRWVNLTTGKTYIGSSGNLSDRFRKYFNINFLEKEVMKNNSHIYRSLIKNGYSNFKLEILEYCEVDILMEREQYYFDRCNPEYNILKIAGSLRGFKHSEATKEIMSLIKKNNIISDETRLKIATTLSKGEYVMVKNNETGEILSFLSIRKAAEFIVIHPSYLAKTLKLSTFYSNCEFLVYKSSTPLENILNDETYKKTITIGDESKKHTEVSKELIRKANLGKKLSLETIQKITLNSSNAKPVLVTNNETKETSEFFSTSAAAKYLGVDESYVRRCITNNKPCKGHTVVRKSVK